MLSDWLVLFSEFIGISGDFLRCFLLEFNLLGGLFGFLESRNSRVIIKDISLSLGKHLKNLLFNLSKFLGVLVILDDQIVPGFFDVGFFFGDGELQKLGLEPFLCDLEVDHIDLGGDLGRVGRVGKFGCHEEAEIFAVLDYFASEFDTHDTSLLELLLTQK